jgi:PAS domain S-box-containing protein
MGYHRFDRQNFFSLEKPKIFSATGEILYSTAPEEIGGINDKEYFKSVDVQHSSGRRIPVEITSSIHEYGGRRVFLGIFRDISQRLKAREEL